MYQYEYKYTATRYVVNESTLYYDSSLMLQSLVPGWQEADGPFRYDVFTAGIYMNSMYPVYKQPARRPSNPPELHDSGLFAARCSMRVLLCIVQIDVYLVLPCILWYRLYASCVLLVPSVTPLHLLYC